VTTLLVLLGAYMALALGIGAAASRRAGSTPEEYFLAGRGLGTLVLFMALFGTMCTPFLLVGIPSLAYRAGIGVFGLNVPLVALGVPLGFMAMGLPARRMAERLGALTPAELYAKRLGSRGIGRLLFVLFTLYTLPYMVGGLTGVAVTLQLASDGAVPYWAGGLAVATVAVVYTCLGGMRATAWTNVFQGFLFLAFSVAALFGVARGLGGFGAATAAVLEHDPDLLRVVGPEQHPLFGGGAWASWGVAITVCVMGFPHMLARLMAARDAGSLRRVSRLYPVALVAIWVPVVMIGVWGAAAFPGLDDPDQVFARMTGAYLPAWFAPVGALAVVAVVMSTLDAQVLTLSSMLVRDVLPHEADSARAARRDVVAGRVFAVALGAAVYLLSLPRLAGVFEISRLAFEGYVMLVPTLFLGVVWRRFNATGAAASLLVGNGLFLLDAVPRLLGGTSPVPHPLGLLPVALALAAGILAGVVGSLVGRPAAADRTAAAFGDA
jgi:SSS family solute:Na+ symporter